MKGYLIIGAIFIPLLGSMRLDSSESTWGFYAHRLINRMAVYTLPPEMMALFKPNIDYISEHSVDPDKRRYATHFEAIRHYIDLEHWGTYPYPDLPRAWDQAIMHYCDLQWISSSRDTVTISGERVWQHSQARQPMAIQIRDHFVVWPWQYLGEFYHSLVLPGYYESPWQISCESMKRFWNSPPEVPCDQILVVDKLSNYGILPYHLIRAQNELTKAFLEDEFGKVLQKSSEIGHYISDAHVPLHTTENYNGQLTGQEGIHAFWESRIPELFAESQYDFLVGKPIYIDDPVNYYWDIVLTSHQYVDSVLQIERQLRSQYPEDRQFCFDQRNDFTVRIQCREYAAAYQDRLSGMVEARMRSAIQAVASAWYTAWIDAGQPDLTNSAPAIDTTVLNVDLPPSRRMIRSRRHE